MNWNSIKEKIKKEGLGTSAVYYFCRVLSKASMHVVGRIAAAGRVRENRLMFKNREFQDFTDNPRALFEYLTKNGYLEKYEIVYAVSDRKKFRDVRMKNVKFVTAESADGFSSPAAFYYGATAKYFFYTHNSADLNRFHCKGQVTVNLWHGCGYKDGGLANRDIPRSATMSAFDYCLVPGKLFVESKAENWRWDRKKILCMGYPRYDWMLDPENDRSEILKRLGFSRERAAGFEKLVIWLPTFRKSALTGQKENEIDLPCALPGLGGIGDLQALDEHCRARRILLFVRKHPLQTNWEKSKQPFTNILDVTGDFLEERGVQFYRLIGVCDALISDYSSAAVDFMLLGRPMAFVLADYEKYKEARGFAFENPLEYMPGEKVYDLEGICGFLTHVAQEKDPYAGEREKLLPLMHEPARDYCGRLLNFLGITREGPPSETKREHH